MDIDLVYLWVDGNDPEWLARKNAFLPADKQVDPQAAGECRYAENDELRYSLRSVELYVPWVRRIYIVTDDQTIRRIRGSWWCRTGRFCRRRFCLFSIRR